MKQPSRITLADCIDQYIADHPDLSPSTIRGYKSIKANRFQSVMHKPIKAVKDWQSAYNADSLRFSPKTMKNTWSLLNTVTEHCGAKLPKIIEVKQKRHEKDFLSHDEILRFVEESKGHKYRIPMLLGLHSLRQSEILALTFGDIDLEADTIRIHRAAVPDETHRLVFKETTKTDLSTRTVPIFIPALHDELKRIKPYRDASDRVAPYWGSTLYKQTSKFLTEHGFPCGGLHLLRHSFASLCFYLDVPILVTCRLGGWSDYRTVMNIYTHLEKAKLSAENDKLTAFFTPNSAKNESKKPLKNQEKSDKRREGSNPSFSASKALEMLDFLKDYIENS
jgi:integrase